MLTLTSEAMHSAPETMSRVALALVLAFVVDSLVLEPVTSSKKDRWT